MAHAVSIPKRAIRRPSPPPVVSEALRKRLDQRSRKHRLGRKVLIRNARRFKASSGSALSTGSRPKVIPTLQSKITIKLKVNVNVGRSVTSHLLPTDAPVTRQSFRVADGCSSIVGLMASETEFKLRYESGDVVDKVEEGGILVHACNCIGAWGSGIALQLKQQFPAAHEIYHNYCQDRNIDDLMGTCLLIPPSESDKGNKSKGKTSTKQVWIACLFTSKGYGRKNLKTGNPGLSKKDEVLKATEASLQDFRRDLEELSAEQEGGRGLPEGIASVRFNAGSFKIPWEETEKRITTAFDGYMTRWTVVTPS